MHLVFHTLTSDKTMLFQVGAGDLYPELHVIANICHMLISIHCILLQQPGLATYFPAPKEVNHFYYYAKALTLHSLISNIEMKYR